MQGRVRRPALPHGGPTGGVLPAVACPERQDACDHRCLRCPFPDQLRDRLPRLQGPRGLDPEPTERVVMVVLLCSTADVFRRCETSDAVRRNTRQQPRRASESEGLLLATPRRPSLDGRSLLLRCCTWLTEFPHQSRLHCQFILTVKFTELLTDCLSRQKHLLCHPDVTTALSTLSATDLPILPLLR
ncbi:unnamed protein product [Lampetra fluviatilis]